MHWKIHRDPYLRPLAERRGEAAVWASGFFFDDDPDDAPLDDVDLRCTPPPKLPVRGERPAVLVLTGALCPVHAGHLELLERARAAVTARGFDVVGAYLSPGHDRYIRMKCGAGAIPVSERLRLCGEAVASSPWISVDPWESLHRRVSVNFTDVVARLRAYLRAHVDPRMEVIYACGADNARFALAFAEEGWCAVVGRPGAYAEMQRWRTELAAHPRVVWAEGDHPGASRLIRASVWQGARPSRVVVRLEDRRAVETLRLARFPHFQESLIDLLQQHAAVRRVALDAMADTDEVISLDAMVPARHTLALSRLYALGGYEPLGHVARPGAPPLDAQVAAIPPGTYALRDDDRMSGSTLACAREVLRGRVTVTHESLAVAHTADEDVADSRDFLLGADHGGLVVQLPDGSIGRAPYALPYVDPAVRCCIAPKRAREFSLAVWALNEAAFAGTELRVGDLPPATRATFAWMGDDRTLEAVCRWHIDALRRSDGPRVT
jgi:hypothetical protein